MVAVPWPELEIDWPVKTPPNSCQSESSSCSTSLELLPAGQDYENPCLEGVSSL